MVLFLVNRQLRWGEHVRHFKARASTLLQKDDFEGMTSCLDLARAMCNDADHELLCTQAVGERSRGNHEMARDLFERAYDLCGGRDPMVVKMLRTLHTL